jgi:hypothetical protein
MAAKILQITKLTRLISRRVKEAEKLRLLRPRPTADATNKADAVDKADATEVDKADVTTADEANYVIGADVFVKAVDSDEAEDAKAADATKDNEVANKADAKANEVTCGSKSIATTMKPKSPVNKSVDPTIHQN